MYDVGSEAINENHLKRSIMLELIFCGGSVNLDEF
jgi:hypothetical protein